MDNLDFSELSDDQLVGLLRAVLRECVSRGPGIQAAAHAAGLDERERAEIAREAADRESAKLRARERERIAREAAEAVRRARKEQEDAARAAEGESKKRREAEDAARAAAEAVLKAERREAESKGWLRRVATLVDRRPGEILITRAHTRYGWRVLVNEGSDEYSSEHLVDYYPETAVIHTSRALVKVKRDLIALCAEFWAINPGVETIYRGSEFDWKDEGKEAVSA